MGDTTDQLLETLRLTPVSDERFLVPELAVEPERDVVFGGELLAQAIAASAHAGDPERGVKSIQAVFARPGRYSSQYEVEVDVMHAGRAFSSHTVTVSQDDALLSRMLLLHSAVEPDLLRYTNVAMPEVAGPDASPVVGPQLVFPGFEWKIVDGVDTSVPDLPAQPPELHVWIRYSGNLRMALPAFAQGALAWATDGYFIGASLLPEPDIDDSQAHQAISTGVVGHTVNFHDEFEMTDWLLLSHEVAWAGRGRIHGRGLVFTEAGQLVASFTQDAMVRRFPGRTGTNSNAKRTM